MGSPRGSPWTEGECFTPAHSPPRGSEHPPGAGGGGSAALADPGPSAVSHSPRPSALSPGGRRLREGDGTELPPSGSILGVLGRHSPTETGSVGKRPSPSSHCHRPIVLCQERHPAASPTSRSAEARGGPRRPGPGPEGVRAGAWAKAQAAGAQKDLDLNLVFRGGPRGLSEAAGLGELARWWERPFHSASNLQSGRGSLGHRGATLLGRR